jgi:hypothetical protein
MFVLGIVKLVLLRYPMSNVLCYVCMQQYDSAVFFCYLDGKVIIIKFDTIVYYSLVYNHLFALNPDRVICMIWNSP